jgi:hypothetical protein
MSVLSWIDFEKTYGNDSLRIFVLLETLFFKSLCDVAIMMPPGQLRCSTRRDMSVR